MVTPAVAASSERLELVLMTRALLEAFLEGPREEAERLVGAAVPADWPWEGARPFLRFRLDQLLKDPAREPWMPRAVVLREERRMIGHAGFHGPPGVNELHLPDAVEIGYSIFEPYRGRGLATEAAVAIMDWAQDEYGVRRFVASVAPDNEPSLAIVRKLGFVHRGEHVDEQDGLELVFELRRDEQAGSATGGGQRGRARS